MGRDFRVGVSRDFLVDGRNAWGDIGLGRLDEAGIAWNYLPADVPVFAPSDLAPYDAVLFAGPAVAASSFDDATPRPALLARFGVGYDAVDLDACTRHGVALTITPDGARRPVALAALTLLLAVQHNLVAKDALVRSGDWGKRLGLMGHGVSGSTIGLFGVGNTASELAALLAPLGVTLVGFDPFCPVERAAELGVELVDRLELARRSDAVVVMAALTPDTHHAVDEAFLEALGADGVLVNVARGPIVDEDALVRALHAGTIRAAGLDVFESEPPTSGIEHAPNLTLAPHALAWTAEMSAGNGNSCVDAILSVAAGRAPRFVVNRDVLQTDAFTNRLKEWA